DTEHLGELVAGDSWGKERGPACRGDGARRLAPRRRRRRRLPLFQAVCSRRDPSGELASASAGSTPNGRARLVKRAARRERSLGATRGCSYGCAVVGACRRPDASAALASQARARQEREALGKAEDKARRQFRLLGFAVKRA